MVNATFTARCKALTDAAGDWALGREWAVAVFLALSSTALLCAIARSKYDRSNVSPAKCEQNAAFASFQRSYIAVFVVIMLADWMQGTHMYTLYTKYQETNESVSVSTLFLSGFMASGVLGTFTGPMVDKYGRKRACMVYVLLEITINLLEVRSLNLSSL